MNSNHPEEKIDEYVDFELPEDEKNGETHADNFKQG
jgi:hypothetical protein